MAAAQHSDAEILAAVERFGKQGAADHLGVKVRGLFGRLARIKRRTESFDPPQGFNAAAVSTLHDADGNVKLQWVKAKQSERSPDEWAQIVKDAFADTPKVSRIPSPRLVTEKLLTVYPIGDQHHGMKAWHEEVGQNFDIRISERLLTGAMRALVDTAPASRHALIVNVGDFFHVDNLKNETARSHHALDVDTRYAEMIRSGIAMLRACIESALAKHQQVKVINAIGNHDDIGALWLSLALACLYEKNPRVSIEQAPGKFHYHRHGSTLIGVTHGDTLKLESLNGVMATDKAAEWGETEHRYWLTGHIHHRKTLELAGCMVESFRTLASRDAWAHAAAYRSGRDMTAIVFHDKHGEVARHRVDVSMLS